ncbi:hypothetical protein GE061_005994 [Apolygus lucorum]|uniref:CCHC-type domain-containing protein n=1 Tax=Apolygus lucorum TaxID=248454 RepID=A0A8S9WV36_APOLU|nr:hypothetical protein GE061_005994 [Apolygus lucorum]
MRALATRLPPESRHLPDVAPLPHSLSDSQVYESESLPRLGPPDTCLFTLGITDCPPPGSNDSDCLRLPQHSRLQDDDSTYPPRTIATGRKSFDFKMMSDADRALDAVAKAMNRLELALSDKPTEPLAEQIPRSVLMEIDPWDPDEIEAVSIGTHFDIFDGITKDLADNLRVQLLRIKLRGTAKTFLLDNGHLLEEEKPYQGLRRALLRWYGRDDPEKAAERLWTIQKSAGETFRQFAERVRHTATQAARADDMLMDATQKRTWIAARSVKAFLKGLPGTYAGYFVNNPPASLEEAMKKAEQLEDALEPRSSDPWNVARIQVQDKRCYRCQELGHIASGCPNIPRPPSPAPIRRKAMGLPHKPCLFCGGMTHFPASCLKNPKNYPCEFCGLYGHKDSECRVKTRQYSDEPMCDYCGYYGHLEAECPQKTESYMQHESSKRPEPRKVLALTSTSHEPNPHQAVALRTEPKNVETPSTSTPIVEEPDVCLPAVDSPFKQTMRIKVNLSGHDRVLIVDTGAQISVLTHPVPGVPIVPTRIQAWGADGQPMPFLGQQRLEVTIGPIKLTHAFRIFARDHSGLDLLGLDLLRRIPASIHLDSCEVRMIHPKTGQSIVISDVITGYLSPARPVPMPDIAQPMRPRIALVGGPHAFDSAHLLRPVNEEEPITDDCPILDSSEEFPIEDLDDPVPDLLSVLNQQLQHLPTEDADYVTRILRVPDDACVTPPVAPMADQRPEPVPCNMEIDDLIPDDEDVYPVARFVEVQQPRKSPEPEDPVKESPPAEVLPEEESQKTAAVAHRQLRRLPKKDYQQLHSGRPSKHPKPETKERRGAVMSKDLRAMIKDVERRLDEEESRDRSPDAEPPVEPQLPPPRALPPRTKTRPKDLDKEWTVLETGAEMMYGAANENELEEGWHRHASAMRVLQENIRGTQPLENPRVDAAEIARAVAQQLQQPQVNIPTSADIAREVVALMNEQLPPTQDPQQWADRIAELIVQKQSPAYSPIHDSGAIARAILIELRQHVSWQLHDAEQDASAPATSHENLATSAPTTSHEHLAASAPSTSRESLPASVSSMPREELVATAPTTSRSELPQAEGTMYESQSEEEDRPVAERRCIACGRNRDHNSRLWCEACRAFL